MDNVKIEYDDAEGRREMVVKTKQSVPAVERFILSRLELEI